MFTLVFLWVVLGTPFALLVANYENFEVTPPKGLEWLGTFIVGLVVWPMTLHIFIHECVEVMKDNDRRNRKGK